MKYVLALTLVLLLSLASCEADTPADTTVAETHEASENAAASIKPEADATPEASEKHEAGVFDDVLSEYINSDNDDLYPHSYALHDIDANGVDELLARISSYGAEEFTYIHTYADGKTHMVGEFWSRHDLFLDKDGNLNSIGSNGAGNSVFEVQRISDDGTSLVKIDTWESNWDGNETVYTNTSRDGDIFISENDFQAVSDTFYNMTKDFLNSLEWKPFPSQAELAELKGLVFDRFYCWWEGGDEESGFILHEDGTYEYYEAPGALREEGTWVQTGIELFLKNSETYQRYNCVIAEGGNALLCPGGGMDGEYWALEGYSYSDLHSVLHTNEFYYLDNNADGASWYFYDDGTVDYVVDGETYKYEYLEKVGAITIWDPDAKDYDTLAIIDEYSLYDLAYGNSLFDLETGNKYYRDVSSETPTQNSESPKVSISVDLATDVITGEYEFFEEEYVDNEPVRIIFRTNAAAKDFKFIAIGLDDEAESVKYIETAVLYSLDELLPEKPLVVTWLEIGLTPHRGISFLDESNITRYFYLSVGGEDGMVSLVEFE